MKFSANLGFLFRELSLVEAVKAAAAAGFAAVECHWPYETPAATLRAALAAARLPLLSINVRPGDRASGDFGVAAIPVSAFFAEAPVRNVVRLCFAKADATLDAAVARLAKAKVAFS